MKQLFASLFVCVAVTSTFAQSVKYDYAEHKLYTEVGAFAGLMKARTDIGGGSITASPSANFSGGMYMGVLYKHLLGARIEYTRGQVREADSLSQSGKFRPRNLQYKSSIQEFSFITEFHFLALNRWGKKDPLKVSPYVMVGVGSFHFNPEVYYNGYWYAAQPLHTEGEGFAEFPERKNYSLTQVNIPAGIGMRVEICKDVSFRLEFLYRFLFTDYLDDISTKYIDPVLFDRYLSPADAIIAKGVFKRRGGSQPGEPRGGSKTKDAYYTLHAKFCMNIGREKSNGLRK